HRCRKFSTGSRVATHEACASWALFRNSRSHRMAALAEQPQERVRNHHYQDEIAQIAAVDRQIGMDGTPEYAVDGFTCPHERLATAGTADLLRARGHVQPAVTV